MSSGCVCGRPADFESCCGAIHSGARPALSAEDLMRSRYAAFVVGDAGYLRHSWAPDRCPEQLRLDPERSWTGLTIHATSGGAAFDSSGTVYFTATYEHSDHSDHSEHSEHSEHSLFRRHEGRWVYVGPAV